MVINDCKNVKRNRFVFRINRNVIHNRILNIFWVKKVIAQCNSQVKE